MAHRFDELAKALAEGMSRREALRRVGGGLVGVILAVFGASALDAAPPCRAMGKPCKQDEDCCGAGVTAFCENRRCAACLPRDTPLDSCFDNNQCCSRSASCTPGPFCL
jgi:hypothetical protein